jgi:LEA14-like dessication related protein
MTSRMLVLLAALLVTSVGCVSKPVVELHSARVQTVSPAGVGMVMTVRVNNKNVFDVRVRNVRANVIIGGKFRLPTILNNPDVWMPANSSTLVPVPITIPWATAMPLLATTVGSTKIKYRAKGFVDVTATRLLGIKRNDYELDEEGEISRIELVQAAMRGGLPMMR